MKNLGKEITATLINDAYLDDDGNFSALAKLSQNDIENTDDEDSGFPVNYAKVRWTTLTDWDGEDGGQACDWEKPEGILFNGQWIADGLDGVNKFNGCQFKLIL